MTADGLSRVRVLLVLDGPHGLELMKAVSKPGRKVARIGGSIYEQQEQLKDKTLVVVGKYYHDHLRPIQSIVGSDRVVEVEDNVSVSELDALIERKHFHAIA